MITKRITALVATVLLILAAVLVRAQIDDNSTSDQSSGTTDQLVCVTELADICRSLELSSLSVRIEESGVTLDAMAVLDPTEQPPLWLTFEPFPAMVDTLRNGPGDAPLGFEVEPIASSPIALVTVAGPTAPAVDDCGQPASWECLGDSGWATGFARSTDSGTGLLGVTQAAIGYSQATGLALTDAQFQRWLRTVVTSVPATRLSGGTAITTIQTRPSSMDIAVGAEAELGTAQSTAFVVQYAEPMIRADVALAVAPDATVPNGLADALAAALVDAGWDPPAATPDQLPDPETIAAIRLLWKELA